MTARSIVIYRNMEGASVRWDYDDLLLTVTDLHVTNPVGAPPLKLRLSTGGFVHNQTFAAGANTNVLLAQAPTMTLGSDGNGGTVPKFTGLDFIGGGCDGR